MRVFFILLVALALVALVPGALAEGTSRAAKEEEPDRQRSLSREQLHREITRLIRPDAESMEFAARLKPLESIALSEDQALLMDVVIVSTAKLPDLSTPRETPVEEFFRTGTVAERIGRRVSTRLWMKGDKGVMLSFSW